MSSLVRYLPTYVKDTNHALHIFDSFRFDNSDLEQSLLFIMDVKSLYTVIPNNCGLQALTYFLETRNVKVPSSLIRLAKLVLTLNAFSFNNVHHCQIGHVVMGGKMGPNYACLFHWIHWAPNPEQYTGFVRQLFTQEVYWWYCWSTFV